MEGQAKNEQAGNPEVEKGIELPGLNSQKGHEAEPEEEKEQGNDAGLFKHELWLGPAAPQDRFTRLQMRFQFFINLIVHGKAAFL